MDRTKIVYDLVKAYNETSWKTQRENIEEAIFSSGKAVNVYYDFQALLNKTYNTISDIWNHGKRFVLYDLCKIADYLGFNIYTFLHSFDRLTKDEFIKVDSQYKSDVEKSVAGALYLEAESLRKNHSKEPFVWNVKKYVSEENDDLSVTQTWRKLAPVAWDFLINTCQTGRETARCWMTVARDKQIPMEDLCKVATAMNTDIIDLLTKHIGE